MSALLTVRSLCVYYGKVEAVHDADLVVQEGQIVTVIGANGAGKSTLLASLMGLLACTGDVSFAGRDITRLRTEERVQRGLSLVPERRELFTEMTVEQNLVLGGFSWSRRRARLQADLDAVYGRFPRLAERRRQYAGTLSGGERQMLAIGRALMARPKLVMLDEPSLGLAPLMVKEMFGAVLDLKALGVAVLLVEQNARAALQVADHAYVLETGQVVLSGPAASLEHDPRVVGAYLGLARGGPPPMKAPLQPEG